MCVCVLPYFGGSRESRVSAWGFGLAVEGLGCRDPRLSVKGVGLGSLWTIL